MISYSMFICQTQFTPCYLKFNEVSQKFKIVSYVLFENMKDRSEQLLALAYVLYFYELYQLYSLKEFRRELGELQQI